MVIYGVGGQVDNINLDKKSQKNMSFEMIIEGALEDVNKILSKFNPDCLVKVKMYKNMVMHPFRFAPFSKLLPEYFKFVAGPETKLPDFMTMLAGCTSFEMKFEFGKIGYNKTFSGNLIWFYNSENHQVSIDFLQRYIKESFENKDEVKCTLFAQAEDLFKDDKPPVIQPPVIQPPVIQPPVIQPNDVQTKVDSCTKNTMEECVNTPVVQASEQPLSKRLKTEKSWKMKLKSQSNLHTLINLLNIIEEAKPFKMQCLGNISDYDVYFNSCKDGVVFKLYPKQGYEISDEDLDKLEDRLIKEGLIVDEA